MLIKVHRGAGIDLECSVDVGPPIHYVQRQAERKLQQHLDPRGRRNRRQAGVRDLFRQPDVDVQRKWRGDLVLEELSQAAIARIDTTQQLAFIEPQAERVIRLPRSGLPRWLLPCQNHRQAIEIGDDATIDGLIDREQPCLVCQELAHRYSFLPLLREFGPVRGYPFFIVEPTTRVGDGERHRSQALGGRVDDHHRVLFPGLARLLVPNTAPKVHNLLSAVKGTASSAQLATPNKVLDERFAHSLKAAANVPMYAETL